MTYRAKCQGKRIERARKWARWLRHAEGLSTWAVPSPQSTILETLQELDALIQRGRTWPESDPEKWPAIRFIGRGEPGVASFDWGLDDSYEVSRFALTVIARQPEPRILTVIDLDEPEDGP